MEHSRDTVLWQQVMRRPRPWKTQWRRAHSPATPGNTRKDLLKQVERQRAEDFAAGWRALDALLKT